MLVKVFQSIMENKNSIEYPFEYKEIEAEVTAELKTYFADMAINSIRLGAKGYFLYKEFDSIVLDIHNMPLRPSDTFVMSFPRSGTTWTQELVWLLQNDCDFETAKSTPLPMRFPYIESGSFIKMNIPQEALQSPGFQKIIDENILVDLKSLMSLPSPRLMKSHIPISLMQPSFLDTVKVVYVARDPRDVAVSNFFHMKSSTIIPNERDFKPFWNFFIQDKVIYAPYFEHLKEAWNLRNHPNMVFIFYEELSKDLLAVVHRLAKFFGKEYTEDQYRAICDHLNFDNFKNNISVNLKGYQESQLLKGDFIRKGKCGGWREHFDEEMTAQAQRWIDDNLRDTDLRFPTVS